MKLLGIEIPIEFTKYYYYFAVTMETLIDDCVIEIFTFLSALDRIKAERVCKRWNFLSKKSWYKHKAIEDDLMKAIGDKKFQNDDFGIGFDAVLSRSQKYVKIVKIDLSTVTPEQIFGLLNSLVEYSENLEVLNFSRRAFQGNIDEMLMYLFLRNKNLTSLVLPTAKITGECLVALEPKKLIEIQLLVDPDIIRVDYLQKAFSSFVNLKILGLEAKFSHVNLVLSEITTNDCKIEKLQVLRIFDKRDSEQPNYPDYFSKMKNLFELNLSYVTLNKWSFKALNAEALTSLLLLAFNTDDYSYFLIFLKSCRNLKNIHIGIDMGNCIKNDVFESLAECKKLYHVHLVNCKNISNEGVAKLAVLPNLTLLQVDRSLGVTLEYVRKKFKHVRKISINGTVITRKF